MDDRHFVDMKWEELASLTDRQMNQLAITQDPVCYKIIQSLKSVEDFLCRFEDLAFDRNLIICNKMPIFSFNTIMASLVFTAGSIVSCCEYGCLADANTVI